MARVIVCGYMIRHPVAGNMFAFFHYILGLHRQGHDVCYLEESGWASSCYDPLARSYGDDPGVGLRLVRALMADHGVNIPVCYVDRDSGNAWGSSWDDVKRMLGAADLLLNIGGVCWLPEFLLCRRRALIDMDPLFTQVGRFGEEGFEEYGAYFSYGVNIGRPGCTIPTNGVEWIPTVPPVVPDVWSNRRSGHAGDVFTTIANWGAYGAVTYRGEHFGQKDEEFLRLLDLPKWTTQKLELALSGASGGVMEQLRAAGWSVHNTEEVSANVSTYQSYITGSRGEFSVAKHAYVKSRSGWFSDRSVCYLAAGLPTVLQDTGFSEWLPTGRGLLAFSTVEEAAERLETVNRDYSAHRRAAKTIVEQTFSHNVVLPRLLESALNGKASAPSRFTSGGVL